MYSTERCLCDDGTNACAFLCLKIAHNIFTNSNSCSWQDIAKISEKVIVDFPRAINDYRDVSKNYDVVEAYEILRVTFSLPSNYELFEKLPYSYGVFTTEGKQMFLEAATNMMDGNDTIGFYTIGFYTCEPYIMLFGSLMGCSFILDTHPVPPSAGGNSTGIIKYFSGMAEESANAACRWLWKQLQCSGVKSGCPQSLLVMRKSEITR